LLQKLKRFCCSSCPYRSNFRSDVVRHIRHKHPTVACAAGVSKLDPVSAAATLADYMSTWARKKFVLHSRRRRCRPGTAAMPQQDESTTDKSAVSSQHGSIANLQPVTSSGIDRTQLSAPEVVNSESPKRFGLEDRLVIDTESEDNCWDGERDHQTKSSSPSSSSDGPSNSEPVVDGSRCPLSVCSCGHLDDCICVRYRN